MRLTLGPLIIERQSAPPVSVGGCQLELTTWNVRLAVGRTSVWDKGPLQGQLFALSLSQPARMRVHDPFGRAQTVRFASRHLLSAWAMEACLGLLCALAGLAVAALSRLRSQEVHEVERLFEWLNAFRTGSFARSALGEPQLVGERFLVPVASVACTLRLDTGRDAESPGSCGGSSCVQPIAIVSVGPEGAKVHEVVDRTAPALALLSIGTVGLLFFRRALAHRR